MSDLAGPRAATEGNKPSQTSWTLALLRVIVWACLIAVALCVAAWVAHGKVGIEKVATSLVMPVGALWLWISAYVVNALTRSPRNVFHNRQQLAWLALWCGLTLCGTPLVSDAVARKLESGYREYRPTSDPPLDTLIVLGGGTVQGPLRPEVGNSGDRVLYAAELYLSGQTRKLIATGAVLPGLSGTSPSEQTLAIWTRLGIPQADIMLLDGMHTFGEMQVLSSHADALGGRRIGLLTSAWHMPRALRLARAAGLTELIPVAADHRRRDERALWDYVPSGENLANWERFQRELVARLVSR